MQEAPQPLDIDELLRQLAALTKTPALDQQAAEQVGTALDAAAQSVRQATTGTASSAATPARQQAVDALSELGVPANPALIAEFCRAYFGSELAPRALASIRRDELRAYRAKSSTRSMWVVPALTTQLMPARGYLALSSWPAWLRIHGTRSARVDMLRVLLVLLDRLAGLRAASTEVLRSSREQQRARISDLVVKLGIGVPGLDHRIDLATAREAIQDELDHIAPKDRAERDAAAADLSTLNEEQRLFGRTDQ